MLAGELSGDFGAKDWIERRTRNDPRGRNGNAASRAWGFVAVLKTAWDGRLFSVWLLCRLASVVRFVLGFRQLRSDGCSDLCVEP